MASVPARCLATRARPQSPPAAPCRARVDEDVARLDLQWCVAGDRRTHGLVVVPASGEASLCGPTHPATCADGHSFTRGGHVAVQQ